MDLAEIVDVGNVHARGVAAPLRELGAHVFFEVREMLAHPEQQVHAIGVVVAGDELLMQSALRIIPAAVETAGPSPSAWS